MIDGPDRFVWLRSFADLDARGTALPAFYYGPVWREHRDAANATMIDSDDVLMLRPVEVAPPAPAPRHGAGVLGVGVLTGAAASDPAAVLAEVTDVLGAPPALAFETEPGENTFPALPVRPERAVVWMARHPDEDAAAGTARQLAARFGTSALRQLRLEPTAGSRLR